MVKVAILARLSVLKASVRNVNLSQPELGSEHARRNTGTAGFWLQNQLCVFVRGEVDLYANKIGDGAKLKRCAKNIASSESRNRCLRDVEHASFNDQLLIVEAGQL